MWNCIGSKVNCFQMLLYRISFGLRFNGFEIQIFNSIGLRFQFFVVSSFEVQLLCNLKVNGFKIQAVRDSIALRFKMVLLSVDLKFERFGCHLIRNSSGLIVNC